MILYKLSETETKFKYYNLKVGIIFKIFNTSYFESQVFGTSCKTG